MGGARTRSWAVMEWPLRVNRQSHGPLFRMSGERGRLCADMTPIRLPALGALTGTALLAWVSGAAAVTPQVTCVAPRPGGLTAYFGYTNPTPNPVIIGVGPQNRFTPAPTDRGQDILFLPDAASATPGYRDDRTYFSGLPVDFTGSVTWNLDGGAATANAASTPCRFDVSAELTTDRATARPGEDVSWTVHIRNTGTSPIPRQPAFYFVTQDLPPMVNVGVQPDEFLPGEDLYYRGITRPGAADCGKVLTGSVQANLALQTREADLTNNTSSASFTVTCVGDLSISATTDATSYSPGQSATYTLTVTNRGDVPVDTAGITVTDPALQGLAPVGAVPAQLAPGASLTYRGTLPITQEMCATGARDDARVSVPGDTNPANNTAFRAVTVTGGRCSEVPPGGGDGGGVTSLRTRLGLATDGSTRVVTGGLATYRITVRNRGRNAARGVVLQQFLPSGAALTQRPSGAKLVSGRLVWRLGTIPAGGTRVVRVSVRFNGGVPGDRAGAAVATAANATRVRTAFETQVVARPRPVRPQPPVAG